MDVFLEKKAPMVRSLAATMHRPLRPIDSGHINAQTRAMHDYQHQN
jgi:hypothetical protein